MPVHKRNFLLLKNKKVIQKIYNNSKSVTFTFIYHRHWKSNDSVLKFLPDS